jgi:hypothetical protein
MFISFSFLLFKRFERAGIGAFFAVEFRVSLSPVKFSGFRTVRPLHKFVIVVFVGANKNCAIDIKQRFTK